MDWSARGTRRNDEWPRADGESVIDYVTATGRFDLLKYQFNLATFCAADFETKLIIPICKFLNLLRVF